VIYFQCFAMLKIIFLNELHLGSTINLGVLSDVTMNGSGTSVLLLI
jgi:hypothetical protein